MLDEAIVKYQKFPAASPEAVADVLIPALDPDVLEIPL